MCCLGYAHLHGLGAVQKHGSAAIDLVVAVETSSNSAVIDKLGGTGVLFTQLLAAAGETAVRSSRGEGQARP